MARTFDVAIVRWRLTDRDGRKRRRGLQGCPEKLHWASCHLRITGYARQANLLQSTFFRCAESGCRCGPCARLQAYCPVPLRRCPYGKHLQPAVMQISVFHWWQVPADDYARVHNLRWEGCSYLMTHTVIGRTVVLWVLPMSQRHAAVPVQSDRRHSHWRLVRSPDEPASRLSRHVCPLVGRALDPNGVHI